MLEKTDEMTAHLAARIIGVASPETVKRAAKLGVLPFRRRRFRGKQVFFFGFADVMRERERRLAHPEKRGRKPMLAGSHPT